jgi:hypothetical protein
MQYEYKPRICQWIGEGEGCSHRVIDRSSYCEVHYPRIFQTLSNEDIDLITESVKETTTVVILDEDCE